MKSFCINLKFNGVLFYFETFWAFYLWLVVAFKIIKVNLIF